MRLKPLAPTVNLAQTPSRINDRWYYPYTRIVSMSISADAVLKGGYGQFMGQVNSAQERHILELASSHPVILTDNQNRDIAYGRWLVAGMATQDSSGSFSIAIANAEISKKKNQIQAETRGIPNSASAKIRGLAGKQLDANSIETFGEAVSSAVQWCIDNANKTGGVAPPGSIYEIQEPETSQYKSICFALNSIIDGKSASEVLKPDFKKNKKPQSLLEIDELIVVALYHRLSIDPSSKPNSSKQKQAKEILNGSKSIPPKNTNIKGWDIDVPPYITSDNIIPALKYLTNDSDKIKIGSWPPPDAELSQPRSLIYNTEVSAKAVVAGGAAGLVEGATDSEARFWVYGYLSKYGRAGVANSIILNETYSAGLQTFIRFLSTDNMLDAQTIASKATLNVLSTATEVRILGVDLSVLKSAATFFTSALNGFDVATLNALGSISAEASEVLNGNIGFAPCLTNIELNIGAPEIQKLVDSADRYCKALKLIEKNNPRSTATIDNGNSLPKIKEIYDFLGIGEKPNKKQRETARDILEMGS